jgi:hypothetical protein
MLPRTIEMVVDVVATGVMADPTIVAVDVGNIGMSFLVAIGPVFGCSGMVAAGVRRAMGRDVSAANGVTTAALWRTAAVFALRKRGDTAHQECGKKTGGKFHIASDI